MIIPAMELCGGRVVVAQADETTLERAEDPVELAKVLYRYGEIALIDLDAARGEGDNLELIREICRVCECRVGGGIRDEKRGDALLRAGATQLIVGTGADEELLARFPRKKVLVGIDVKDGKMVHGGWIEATDIDPVQLAVRLQEYCAGFVYTPVGHRDRLEPAEVQRFEELQTALPRHRFIFNGGFSSLDELRELDRIGVDTQVSYGLIPEGVDLAEAFVAVIDFEKSSGLVPVIVQDQAGQVLTLVYANEDAVHKSLQTGKATYWSPGRGEMYTKGQTSGNTHEVITVRPDCDRDALLFVVEPHGASCHVGRYACFDDISYNLQRIEQMMRSRQAAADARKSYTSLMLADRQAVKDRVRDEAEALVAAKSRDEVLWETADLLYFVLLHLVGEGITLDEVLKELRGRAGRRRS
ncbi:MAG: phosphoribosyl-ATP diphosphatase [bacterium]